MINFRRPAFQDVNNFCNKDFVYEAIVSVQSCTSQLRHWKHKNRLTTTVHIHFILTGLFRIHLQLSFGHMLTCYIFRFVSLLCSLRVTQVTIRDLQIQRRGRLRVRDLTLSFFAYSKNIDSSPVSFILPFLNRKVSTVIFSEGGENLVLHVVLVLESKVL